MDEADINAYLYFGYLPRVNTENPFWALHGWDQGEARQRLAKLKPTELIDEGVRALATAMTEALDGLQDEHTGGHVVHLSGGFDSRAVLGELLRSFDSSEIQVETHGLPGFPDFELARAVSQKAGLPHHFIDVRESPWTTSDLVKFVREVKPNPYQPVLHGPYGAHIARKLFGTSVLYWGGFLGDALSGAHLPPDPSENWEIAVQRFVRINRGGGITIPGYNRRSAVPPAPLVSAEAMTFTDQLDCAVRQPFCIYTRSKVGHETAYLFQQPSWVNFMLNVPVQHRRGQSLYREILKTAYPKLFSLPTTHDLGIPLTAPRWLYNAQRVKHRMRQRLIGRKERPSVLAYVLRDHADLVEENLQALESRNVIHGVDISGLWVEHTLGGRNLGTEINALVSLEVNLKAMEQNAPVPR